MKRIPTPALLAAALVLISCETVINIDLPTEEHKLVTHAIVSPVQRWSVDVTHSVGVLGTDDPAVVVNAAVEIHRDGEFVEKLIYAEGRYAGTRQPEAGAAYTLHVEAPGYSPIQAQDMIPLPVPVSATMDTVALLRSHPNAPFEVVRHSVSVRFDDPPGIRNSYALLIEGIDLADGQAANAGFVQFSTRDAAILDANQSADIEASDGIFAGHYGDFTDAFFDGRLYEISLWFDEYVFDEGAMPEPQPDRTYRLRLRHLSETLYRHDRSRGLYESAQYNPFSEPVRLFSNVENGYGIFAGYSESEIDLEVDRE